VVLLAHAGALNALCLLGMDGDFRYLADLERAASPPLAHAPAAWSSDGRRIAFFAPSRRASEPQLWMAPSPRRGVYVAELDAHDPRLVAEVDGAAAAWREDGRLLVAARQPDERSVAIKLLNATGEPRTLLQVALGVGHRSALTWSVATGQLLVVDASSGTTEYWLVGLAAEQPA
jgi:hypothetical protein